jgi:hypothetical protein
VEAAVTMMEILGIWFAAAMTLFILSFLYKDNPFYRLAEHIFVGVSIGYSLVVNIWQVIWPDWVLGFGAKETVGGVVAHFVPGLLGILGLARMVPQLSWLSRPTFAFVMGWGAGVAIPTAVDAFVLKHTSSTVSPLVRTTAEGGIDLGLAGLWGLFTSLIVVVIVLCVLVYFFFSIEHKGPIRVVSRLGILFLMVAFGIAYGNTVMGRMSLLYNRFLDLRDWSKQEYGYATPILVVLLIISLIGWDAWNRRRQQTPPPVETGPPQAS